MAKAKKTDKPAKAKSATKTKAVKADEQQTALEIESENTRIKFKSTMPRAEAVAYFEAIVSGLRKGAMNFKQGEDAVSLSPSEQVEVEVKARRKRNRENVSFEITWQTSDETALTISSN